MNHKRKNSANRSLNKKKSAKGEYKTPRCVQRLLIDKKHNSRESF